MAAMTSTLKAPFPAFGGKSRVADLVWSRLGAVRNYVEPFCFSAAMLLLRPSEPQIETINDLNAFVANFWRAIQKDPEAVAIHADWPVNETDLHSRHAWLVRSHEAAERLQQVRDDSEYFDAKIAGWWCWGACMWIGSGWCDSQQIPHISNQGQGVNSLTQQIPHMDESRGIIGRQFANPENRLPSQIPELGGGFDGRGRGVVRSGEEKRPQLCNGSTTHGQGVHKMAQEPLDQKRPVFPDKSEVGRGVQDFVSEKRPHIGSSHEQDHIGTGVLGRPQLGDAYARGRGVHANDALTDCDKRRLWLAGWFAKLSDRLRPVRVCCGHWDRICDSDSTLTRLGLTGVFLDPPYRKTLADGKENRAAHIYANDKSQDVGALCDEVQAWCLKWDGSKQIRIAVCGLEGEYPELGAAGWDKVAWKSQGGYGNRNKNNENAARERIWFNKSCLTGTESKQAELFND